MRPATYKGRSSFDWYGIRRRLRVAVHVTRGAAGLDYRSALRRHFAGDWGDLCAEDRAANERGLESGDRILSAYTVDGTKVWVISDAPDPNGNRYTTVMLPEEY